MNLILYCYLLWVKPSGKTTVLPCEGTARYIDKKEKHRAPGLPMFRTYFLFTEPTSNIFFSSYKNWKCGIFCGITTLYDLLQINNNKLTVTDLLNAIKKMLDKISFHKHFKFPLPVHNFYDTFVIVFRQIQLQLPVVKNKGMN